MNNDQLQEALYALNEQLETELAERTGNNPILVKFRYCAKLLKVKVKMNGQSIKNHFRHKNLDKQGEEAVLFMAAAVMKKYNG